MAVLLYRSGFRRLTWFVFGIAVAIVILPPALFFVFEAYQLFVASVVAFPLAGLATIIGGLLTYRSQASGLLVGLIPVLCWPVFVYLEVTGYDTCKHMQFQRFLTADRVEIKNNMGQSIMKDITSPEQIQRLARFAVSYESKKWIAPNLGVPGAKVRAEFHKGEAFLGDFGYEPTFFAAQGCRYFYIHSATSEETQSFARLISGK
jgi:hypothetical protein